MAAKEKQEEESAKEPQGQRPSPLVHDPDDTWGPLWMGIGLLLFGAAVGLITGLSFAPGISQSLLTSVFTFAGGALLTYGGFVRVQRTGSTGLLLRTSRVGISLCCFSVGIVGGMEWGIHERLTRALDLLKLESPKPDKGDPKADSAPSAPDKPGSRTSLLPLAGLQGAEGSMCLVILNREETDYAGEAGRTRASGDLKWVREHLSCVTGQASSPP